MRTDGDKIGAVRDVLAAARELVARRSEIAPAVVETSGLSPEGVERGFVRHLELDADLDDLTSLVRGVGDADHCAVVLSANVFVAPVRAVALAVATAPRVLVRPSRREPHVAERLVALLASPNVTLVREFDYPRLPPGELHVYGRNETIASIRSELSPQVRLRGHGAGFGVACVSSDADDECQTSLLAADVVAFDQRGCLSPRVVFVEGDHSRARRFCAALDRALARAASEVPRGVLDADEVAEARAYADLITVAGDVWQREEHLVGLADTGAPLLVPPPGRNLHVVPVASPLDVSRHLSPFSSAVVAVGSDDVGHFSAAIPNHARTSALGSMQRPRLDGPVDRRLA